jgi:hypothetical protein
MSDFMIVCIIVLPSIYIIEQIQYIPRSHRPPHGVITSLYQFSEANKVSNKEDS